MANNDLGLFGRGIYFVFPDILLVLWDIYWVFVGYMLFVVDFYWSLLGFCGFGLDNEGC